MKKALFFTHSAGRTGSETALFNIIRHVDRKKLNMALVSGSDGTLLEQVPEDVPVYTQGGYWKKRKGTIYKIYNKIYWKILEIPEGKFFNFVNHEFKPDFWYINTIILPNVLAYAAKNNIPCVVHTHELEHMMYYLCESEISNLVKYPKLVIACSDAAAGVFRTLGRNTEIEVIYPSIQIENIKCDKVKTMEIRKKLHIEENTFLWVMSGNFDSNKNPVLFVEIANEILKYNQDAHFMWVGGELKEGLAVFARKKAEFLGISKKITWTGYLLNDYYYFLDAADGFILTSAKESFSLVSVEALALGKPVVSFDSRGIKEVLQNGTGLVVNSLNTEDIVKVMLKVMQKELIFDPINARKQAEKFDCSVTVKKWEEVMERYFGTPKQGPL